MLYPCIDFLQVLILEIRRILPSASSKQRAELLKLFITTSKGRQQWWIIDCLGREEEQSVEVPLWKYHIFFFVCLFLKFCPLLSSSLLSFPRFLPLLSSCLPSPSPIVSFSLSFSFLPSFIPFPSPFPLYPSPFPILPQLISPIVLHVQIKRINARLALDS